jgi:aminoglycoside/choline kinase family phosphotransferase
MTFVSARRSTISDARLELLRDWLAHDLTFGAERIAPASGDASFRRYFRIWRDGETFIAMDAPPEREDVRPYLRIARMLAELGVHVPRILAEQHTQGFLLVTDLGTRHYLEDLTANHNVESHYLDAMMTLNRIQSRGAEHASHLPDYERAILEREMKLMPEWFCGRHLKLELNADDQEMLAATFDFLCREALAQPRVFVHRDYHSRNLMVFPGDNPGVLDFQDALRGPVTYDLVSLFRDCYIEWPEARVQDWVLRYRAMAQTSGVSVGASEAEFVRWFDLMGVQRHVKVLGIFSRLCHRDGKTEYLNNLPLTLKYVRSVCGRHAELEPLGHFLSTRVAPILSQRTVEARA